MVSAGSGWSRLVPAGPGRSQSVPAGPGWSRLVPGGICWSQLVPAGPGWSWLVPTGPVWSRLALQTGRGGATANELLVRRRRRLGRRGAGGAQAGPARIYCWPAVLRAPLTHLLRSAADSDGGRLRAAQLGRRPTDSRQLAAGKWYLLNASGDGRGRRRRQTSGTEGCPQPSAGLRTADSGGQRPTGGV